MEPMQFYSQYGEDRVLYETFDKKLTGVCVEVGGFDGVTGSNSYFFEKLGWDCLIVEPQPDFCAAIRKVRKARLAEYAASDKEGEAEFYVAGGVETLSTMEENPGHFERIAREGGNVRKISVKTKRLDDILAEAGITRIDFISIDVEGHELSALKGFSVDKFLPRIVLLEDNINSFSSEIPAYLKRYGYERFKRTGCNDWYGRAADRELFTSADVFLTRVKVLGDAVAQGLKNLAKPLVPAGMVKFLRGR